MTTSPPRTRGDNLYFRYKMGAVRADMTDAEIERLSDGNGRILTSLLGQRARLRNTNIDNFCRCWDEWHALMQQWRQTQDNEIWQGAASGAFFRSDIFDVDISLQGIGHVATTGVAFGFIMGAILGFALSSSVAGAVFFFAQIERNTRSLLVRERFEEPTQYRAAPRF